MRAGVSERARETLGGFASVQDPKCEEDCV